MSDRFCYLLTDSHIIRYNNMPEVVSVYAELINKPLQDAYNDLYYGKVDNQHSFPATLVGSIGITWAPGNKIAVCPEDGHTVVYKCKVKLKRPDRTMWFVSPLITEAINKERPNYEGTS